MYSITKTKLDNQTITAMAKKAFPDKEIASIKEVGDGYFSSVYDIHFVCGQECILKVAPPKEIRVQYYECNAMETEVAAIRMVAEKADVPVPAIYLYDNSGTVCPSPYFFMEKLKGSSIGSLGDLLTEEQKKDLQTALGRFIRVFHNITGERFGYPGQPDLQGENWFDVFRRMLQMAVKEAQDMSVDLKISIPALWACLERDSAIFDSVKTPRLVHWDLWDPNIFVESGKFTGIIDWERSLWADPLMEFGYWTCGRTPYFLEGYGKERLSEPENRRLLWYIIYALLLFAPEYIFRQYDSADMYHWAIGLLAEKFADLQNAPNIG